MKTKGFTLAELLGVIVVLGIIALITMPIISDFINESEISSVEKSADNYIKAVNDTIMSNKLISENLDGRYLITPEGDLCPAIYGAYCIEPTVIEAEGNRPTMGIIEINESSVVKTNSKMVFEEYAVTYDIEDSKYIATEGYDLAEFIPTAESFENDSWVTIVSNVRSGNLSKYKVGDEKKVTLSGSIAGTYTVRIANVSTPEECSTEGFSQTACGFVIEFVDIVKEMQMHKSTAADWIDSDLRFYLQNTMYGSLPIELQNNIIETYSVSELGPQSGEKDIFTVDKLYLLSVKEVFGVGETDVGENYSRQLDYYKNKNVSKSNSSGALKKYNSTNSLWWLRDVKINWHPQVFYCVSGNGGALSWKQLNDSRGLSPAFRIG